MTITSPAPRRRRNPRRRRTGAAREHARPTRCRKRRAATSGAAARRRHGRARAAAAPPAPAPRRRRRGCRIRRRAPLHVITDVLDIDINLEGRRNRSGRSHAVSAAQGHAEYSGAAAEPRTAADAVSAAERAHRRRGRSRAHASRHLDVRRKNPTCSPPGANELRVPLTWTDGQGLTVTKTFVFTRGWYAIGLDYEVKNAGAAPRKLASYAQIPAPLGTRLALLLRRRDLFLQGTGRLRRHQVHAT